MLGEFLLALAACMAVFAVFLAVARHGLTPLFALTKPSGGLLSDSAAMAQLRLLSGWRPVASTALPHHLCATDLARGRFVVLASEPLMDFTEEMDLRSYAELMFQRLLGQGQLLEMNGPAARAIGGLNAVQREAVIAFGPAVFKYLHTAIEGTRAFHQVLAWAPPSRYDRSTFEKLVDSFTEVPGPAQAQRASRAINPPSDYDIH